MLGLVGKEGSELRCSEHLPRWNVVNKDLLHPTLLGRSPRCHMDDPVYLLTVWVSSATMVDGL